MVWVVLQQQGKLTMSFALIRQRLDSFIELVTSSIEYTESTSHQLQPARSRPLDVNQLKHILELAKDMREKRAYQASSATQ